MASNINIYSNHLAQVASKFYNAPEDEVRLFLISDEKLSENTDDPIVEYVLEIGDRVRVVLRDGVFDSFNSYSIEDFTSKLLKAFTSKGVTGEILDLH